MKLTIELVPKTSWFTNLRSELSKEQWDKIRNECYRKAKHKCEVCGGRGSTHPVECHEIWHYDDKRKIQRLDGVVALCPMCHACKHIGLSINRGMEHECCAHLMRVNKLKTLQEAESMIDAAFETWDKRSRQSWTLDISIVEALLKDS